MPPVFEIFSDKMVITSYGGLIWGQTEEEFFSCSSMPRNRELMRVFKDLGLVEQLGSGMSRILHAYSKDIFSISEHFIKVTLPFENEKTSPKTSPIHLNNTQKQIVAMIEDNGKVTQKEIAENIGVTLRAVKLSMKYLVEQGILYREGSARNGVWRLNN